MLIGGDGYIENYAAEFARTNNISLDLATHLTRNYGDRAEAVLNISKQGLSNALVPGYPNIEAEVVYAARHELACTVIDVLAHRTRLAFLDQYVFRWCTSV